MSDKYARLQSFGILLLGIGVLLIGIAMILSSVRGYFADRDGPGEVLSSLELESAASLERSNELIEEMLEDLGKVTKEFKHER